MEVVENIINEPVVDNFVEAIAKVQGELLIELPKDLYIPPDALEVVLEMFEGPLDLLLYLIKRQNLDILDIPIAEITRQYMQYIDVIKNMRFELAAEYLVMAAMLAEIKSRLLLPRPGNAEEEGEDPRAELVRRLQEYERFKLAAEQIDALPLAGRDVFPITLDAAEISIQRPLPKLELADLLNAFLSVMKRAELMAHHHIQLEPLSVRERMAAVLTRVSKESFVEFQQLFDLNEGRAGIVVTFLAILELMRESLLELVQAEPFATIHIKAVA